MWAIALSILAIVIYFILMYIFGITNKNTPKFTPGSFTSTLHTSEGSTKPYKEEPKENTAEYYKHILELMQLMLKGCLRLS